MILYRRQILRSHVLIAVIAVISGLVVGVSLRSLAQRPAAPLYRPPVRVVTSAPTVSDLVYPLTIKAQRARAYPGGAINIESQSTAGPGWQQSVVSYPSDGLKIFALKVAPNVTPPAKGFPVVIIIHGFIPPNKYDTTNNPYLAYAQEFAAAGYAVLMPDLRGYGNSWGSPEGAYYSPGYTADVLNLVASLKSIPGLNATRVSLWGHSMGGHVVLSTLAVAPARFRSAVIAAGAVGTLDDMYYNWRAGSDRSDPITEGTRQHVIKLWGEPRANPGFWEQTSPYSALADIKLPIQLQVARNDNIVPPRFTDQLSQALTAAGHAPEVRSYASGGHSFTGATRPAAIRSALEFYAH